MLDLPPIDTEQSTPPSHLEQVITRVADEDVSSTILSRDTITTPEAPQVEAPDMPEVQSPEVPEIETNENPKVEPPTAPEVVEPKETLPADETPEASETHEAVPTEEAESTEEAVPTEEAAPTEEVESSNPSDSAHNSDTNMPADEVASEETTDNSDAATSDEVASEETTDNSDAATSDEATSEETTETADNSDAATSDEVASEETADNEVVKAEDVVVVTTPTDDDLLNRAKEIKAVFDDGFQWSDLGEIIQQAYDFIVKYQTLTPEEMRNGVIGIVNHIIDITDTPYLPDMFTDPLFKAMVPPFVDVFGKFVAKNIGPLPTVESEKPTPEKLMEFANTIKESYSDGFQWEDLATAVKASIQFIGSFPFLPLEEKKQCVVDIVNHVIDVTDTPHLPDSFIDPVFKSMVPSFVEIIFSKAF